MTTRASKHGEITKTILQLLATAGVISAALLFPGLGVAWQKYKQLHRYDRRKVTQALKRLQRQKLVRVAERNDETVIELSENGRKRVISYQIENLQIQKTENWDSLWRLVIFDIPDKKKLAREVFRRKLKQLGFYMLQESVFVTPYPCKEEINLLTINYQIRPYILYITAKSIQPEAKLRQHFNL